MAVQVVMPRILPVAALALCAAIVAARADTHRVDVTTSTLGVTGYVCPSADARCEPNATVWQPIILCPGDVGCPSPALSAVPVGHLRLVPEGDCHDGDVVEFFHGEMRCAPRDRQLVGAAFGLVTTWRWRHLTERECVLIHDVMAITAGPQNWTCKPEETP